jgi:CheY-like chemotaxis protein
MRVAHCVGVLFPLLGLVILVVDDDMDVLDLSVEVLRVAGAEVERAACPAQAFAILATKHVDAVLCDIAMPEMDGLELARTIRSTETMRSLPVIALTARCAPEDREAAMAAGFDEYVLKRGETDKIVSALARVVGDRVHPDITRSGTFKRVTHDDADEADDPPSSSGTEPL